MMKRNPVNQISTLFIMIVILLSTQPLNISSQNDTSDLLEIVQQEATVLRNANVRETASTSSSIIAILTQGEKVTILGESITIQDNSVWYEIRIDAETTGFVWSGLLSEPIVTETQCRDYLLLYPTDEQIWVLSKGNDAQLMAYNPDRNTLDKAKGITTTQNLYIGLSTEDVTEQFLDTSFELQPIKKRTCTESDLAIVKLHARLYYPVKLSPEGTETYYISTDSIADASIIELTQFAAILEEQQKITEAYFESLPPIEMDSITLGYTFNMVSSPIYNFYSEMNNVPIITVDNFTSIQPLARYGDTYGRFLAWTPDGRMLIYADQGINFHDVNDLSGQAHLFPTEEFLDLAVSPDNKRIVLGCFGLWLWENNQLKRISSESTFTPEVEYSPDGKLIASKTSRAVQLYDASQPEITFLEAQLLEGVYAIKFSPDSTQLYIWKIGSIDVWDIQNSTLKSIELPVVERPEDYFSYPGNVDISPDGSLLVFAETLEQGNLGIWNLTTDKLEQSINIPGYIGNALFSPDNQYLVISYRNENYEYYIDVWDLNTKSFAYSLATDDIDWVTDLEFSPDGTQLAGSDGVMLWDFQTGELIEHKPFRSFYKFAISPDGNRLLATGVNFAQLIDLNTGDVIKEYILEQKAFDYDSHVFLKQDGDHAVFVVNNGSANQVELTQLDLNSGSVEVLNSLTGSAIDTSMSYDRHYLAIAREDNTVSIYDLESDEFIGNENLHDDAALTDIEFAVSENTLITSGENQKLSFWNIDTGNIKSVDNPLEGSINRLFVLQNNTMFFALDNNGYWNLWSVYGSFVKQIANTPSAYGGSENYSLFSSADGNLVALEVGFLWINSTQNMINNYFNQSGKSMNMSALAFTPDRKKLISITAGTLTIWGVPTGDVVDNFCTMEADHNVDMRNIPSTGEVYDTLYAGQKNFVDAYTIVGKTMWYRSWSKFLWVKGDEITLSGNCDMLPIWR